MLAFLSYVFKGTPLGEHEQVSEQLIQPIRRDSVRKPVWRPAGRLSPRAEILGFPPNDLPDVLQGRLPRGGVSAAQAVPPDFGLPFSHDNARLFFAVLLRFSVDPQRPFAF